MISWVLNQNTNFSYPFSINFCSEASSFLFKICRKVINQNGNKERNIHKLCWRSIRNCINISSCQVKMLFLIHISKKNRLLFSSQILSFVLNVWCFYFTYFIFFTLIFVENWMSWKKKKLNNKNKSTIVLSTWTRKIKWYFWRCFQLFKYLNHRSSLFK